MMNPWLKMSLEYAIRGPIWTIFFRYILQSLMALGKLTSMYGRKLKGLLITRTILHCYEVY